MRASNSHFPPGGSFSPPLPPGVPDLLLIRALDELVALLILPVTPTALLPRYKDTTTSSRLATPPVENRVGGDREMLKEPPTSPIVTTGLIRRGTGTLVVGALACRTPACECCCERRYPRSSNSPSGGTKDTILLDVQRPSLARHCSSSEPVSTCLSDVLTARRDEKKGRPVDWDSRMSLRYRASLTISICNRFFPRRLPRPRFHSCPI